MFRTQIINKSNRSAVAYSAYRSGETLYSERDGLVKSYSDREVLAETYILSPQHAPKWVQDREKLWNEVEKIEKQHNAQLAREIVFALPVQLTNEEQTQLTLYFCKQNFSDQGMVADIAIHRDKKQNPHVHVMLTLRPFEEDGSWGKKRQKIEGKSIHLTNWNERETMIQWRKSLADCINQKFHEKGLADRVSHESYEKQGKDKLPRVRLSRDAYQYEKRSEKKAVRDGKKYEPVTYYGKLNKEIQEINKELQSLKKKDKIVSIEGYQAERSMNESFQSIRKQATLNDAQKAALTFVHNRSKTFVDYTIASRVLNEINEGNWKRKLQRQQLNIQAEKNVLNKALRVYEKQPKQVINYGFDPSHFKVQLKEKISNLKDMQQTYEREKQNYDAAKKKAELALDLQKDFTNQEFHMLYPSQPLNQFGIEEKYQAVQHFKETGSILSLEELREHANKKGKGQPTNQFLPSLANQTRNISKSIFILDRAIKKQSRERIEALQLKDFEKAYEASRKMEQYGLQKKTFTNELQGNHETLRNELETQYDSELLANVTHTEVLLRLYQLSEQGQSTGNLHHDMILVQREFEKEKEIHPNSKSAEEKIQLQYSQNVTDGLFQALEQIQRAQEDMKHEKDPTKKRQKRRYRGQDLDR